MTKGPQIAKRVSKIQHIYRDELDKQDDEFMALLETVFGRCCNCDTRMTCLRFFMATMGVDKERLIEAAVETQSRCHKRYSWKGQINTDQGQFKLTKLERVSNETETKVQV